MLTAQELITDSVKLFSLPEVYLDLKRELEDPNYSLQKVAEIIARDPALTTRLLRMVNSAFFGFGMEIDTVTQAVNMLGTQQVHDLALATAVTDTFSDMPIEVMDMALFWRNSLHCGVLARLLANHCNVLDGERLFVAGLLCDIGHLLMYQKISDQMQLALRHSKQLEIPLHQAEQELIGFDYAELGAELMRVWGLPTSLQTTTRHHLLPGNAHDYTLQTAIVHIAAAFTVARQQAPLSIESTLPIDPVAWQVTGLCNESLEPFWPEVELQLAQTENLLF